MSPTNTALKPQTLLPFAKMHGLGNDFVLVRKEDLESLPLGKEILADWKNLGALLARTLCDRHFGIGADGFILVSQPDDKQCEVAWTFLNRDGSHSDMCGNGLRCLALFHNLTKQNEKREFFVQTNVGAMPVAFNGPEEITIDLKEPILTSKQIPFQGSTKNQVVKETITAGGASFAVTCVNMGNPHCVIFAPEIDEQEYLHYAPLIQKLPEFPEGVNVEFVQVLSPDRARVMVFERGAGATLACATGAAATLVAGVLEGRLGRQAVIELPGGSLKVYWSQEDNHVRLTGPATFAFTGTIDISSLRRSA